MKYFPGEIYEMLSSNLRGGMSFSSQRYTESAVFEDSINQKRTLDEKGRHNVILDIDANNLYGCSQTLPLPWGNFQFLSEEEKTKINWSTIDLTKEKGYFVEVTLKYPSTIHEKTKSFPLCPENIEITEDMLSPYQRNALKQIYQKSSYKAKN